MNTGIDVSPMNTPQLRRKEWLAVPFLILMSAAILLVAFLQYNWPGKWLGSAPALSWNGAALKLTKGQGFSSDRTLAIEGLGEQGIAVASLSPRAFQAKDYSAVSWAIAEVPPGAELAFLWRTVENPNRIFARPISSSKSGTLPLELAGDENWRGQIMGLALTVKGQLDAPITVKGLSLKPVSAGEAMAKMAGRWFALDGWQGTSINFVDGDAAEQDVSYVSAVAALLVVALALYLALVKFKRLRIHVTLVWGLVFIGWLALDARWQWNLLRQLDLTRQQFAGKSWEDKHLAADDGPLFDFMRQVKAKLPAAPGRILFFSDDAYLRGKGAYFLYPYNVMVSPNFFAPDLFKSGDHIVLLGKKEMQYDAAHQSMEWAGAQLRADLLLSSGGNLLLKVR